MTNPTGSVPVRPGGTFVYRIHDRAGRLLYVGITDDLLTRSHRRDRDKRGWWWDAARVEWELFPTREAALKEEARLIRFEDPAYNVVGRYKHFHVILTADGTHDPDCQVGLRERVREVHARRPAL